MQFYFIRHAQSKNNAIWDQNGNSRGRSDDPELTDAGLKQAYILADFLAAQPGKVEKAGLDPQNTQGFPFTHLYCSLMTRSIQTGSAVSTALGIPLTAWFDFHETGGIYLEDEPSGELRGQPGKTRTQLLDRFPSLVLPETVTESGWWNRPFENEDERLPRARRVLEDLLARHGETEDRVAVVSHGGFFNAFMTALLGFDQFQNFWFQINNASITRIDFFEESFGIVYLNRLEYMPRDLIT
jgi:2,3-bisphosphoglycerate-dependent phosphoglycerate mutase